MKRVLILGSGGFIGQHLSQYLAQTHDVWTCSRTGSSHHAHVVIDPLQPDYRTLIRHVQPDVCINCSGAANVSASFLNPTADFELNVALVSHLLSAIREEAPNVKFIHLSSAAVYGNPNQLPVREDEIAKPMSPYGYHKMMAEAVCRSYTALFGVQTLSLRIFSAYGPMLSKQLFWDIFRQWRDRNFVELGGTGDETRDFIYVEDVCQAIKAVMNGATFDGSAINVGSGIAVSIKEAANTLLEYYGGNSASFTGKRREGDPVSWQADIQLLRSYGFRPAVSIQDGLKETAEWHAEQQ
jgi:UDP-glucose 4-epimerase